MKRSITIAAILVASVAAPLPILASPAACTPGSITAYLAYGTSGCLSGDLIYSNFSFTDFNPTTTLSVTDNGIQHTFSAAGLNLNVGTSAIYSYLVSIAPGNPFTSFLAYRTGATTSGLDPLVSTKTLTGSPAGATSTATNQSSSNIVTYSPLTQGPVAFTGTIDVTSGRMDVFTDSVAQQVDVPGPLPLFGIGAAFSFSRRLRKRARPSS